MPIDVILDTAPSQIVAPNPVEYIKDMKIQLRGILLNVTKNLNISRKAMMKHITKM